MDRRDEECPLSAKSGHLQRSKKRFAHDRNHVIRKAADLRNAPLSIEKEHAMRRSKTLVVIGCCCWVQSAQPKLRSRILNHDIYSGFRDQNGNLCCGGQDCRPVKATMLPNGNYYLPESDETIPADMATPSPDDRFHHCTDYSVY
jgi:hypothetical protein